MQPDTERADPSIVQADIYRGTGVKAFRFPVEPFFTVLGEDNTSADRNRRTIRAAACREAVENTLPVLPCRRAVWLGFAHTFYYAPDALGVKPVSGTSVSNPQEMHLDSPHGN